MTLYQVKEQGVVDTPLFLFDVTFGDGTVYHWSSYHATVQDTEYVSRVVRTNIFEMQACERRRRGYDSKDIVRASERGRPHVRDPADGRVSRGGAICQLCFLQLVSECRDHRNLATFSRASSTLPRASRRPLFRVSAINRLSLQRIALPPVQVQSRCPWQFPATPDTTAGGGYRRLGRPVFAVL